MDADAALAARLADDLDGTFPTLAERHVDRLYTIGLRLLGERRDAEEVAQDALVRAYRAIASYDRDRTATLELRPWLARITVNLARNRRRTLADRRPPASLGALLDGGFEPLAADPGPEAAGLRREARDRWAARLLRLPAAYRTAVVLRHVDGLSVREISIALDRPEGTIKAQVHRGLRLLRAAYEADLAAGREEKSA